MVNRIIPITGYPGITQKITCSDISTALTLPEVDGMAPIGALITVEDNACRIAFGVNATTSLGHKLSPGQSMKLYSASECADLEHINETALSNSVMQITYYYAY